MGARRPKRLSAVLTCEEVEAVLAEKKGKYRLATMLIYASGVGRCARAGVGMTGGVRDHRRTVRRRFSVRSPTMRRTT